MAAAVVEFCATTLSADPPRVGKRLFGPFTGCHGARRGTYRVDEAARTVHVLHIDHRADVYRPR